MARWGMLIDLDRCTACQACVVACQVENNVPPGGADQAELGRAISWMRLVPFQEGGDEHGTRPDLPLVPPPCTHFQKPPCTKVCPVKATQIDHEGLVAQVYPRCIGCRYCTTACPYTVRHFNWKRPEWPQPMEQGLSPDVSVRPKGVVEKCSFCHHRLQQAKDKARAENPPSSHPRPQQPKDKPRPENRPPREGDYQPACVETCPAEAMVFGDLDDPRSGVSRLSESPRAFRPLGELGTNA